VVDDSFAALQGPVPYIKHLISPTRIPFTAMYFGSLAMTLYFSIGVCAFVVVLIIVTLYDFDITGSNRTDCGIAEFLCVVCAWGDFKFEVWRKNRL
jgi:hypothetical protein